MDAQGIFGSFWTETQFICKRNCGGSVQKILKIAPALLSQECSTRYLCTIKIKPRPATREVGNAYQYTSLQERRQGFEIENKTYAVCFARLNEASAIGSDEMGYKCMA